MKKRFLLIAGFPDSILNFRGSLLNAIAELGLEVHVTAPGLDATSPTAQQLVHRGFVVHDLALSRTGMNPIADFRTFLELYRLMRSISPDYLLSYTIKPVIYGCLAAGLCGVRHRFALITGLGYAFLGGDRRKVVRYLVQQLYRISLSMVEKVFFQNPDDASFFSHHSLIRKNAASCVVNGSGVDVTQFSPRPIPLSPVRFLLIARLLGDKGVREFVEAARCIRLHHPEVSFSIVGAIDSNPDAILHSELESWIAEGVIDYAGQMRDVRPAIGNCSVYVLPSYREGTPRTVLEAMAMGRPIVTTNVPGCRQTVVEGYNGFLVSQKSVEGLVEAMMRFVQEPELAVSMGRNSRILAEERYDVHKVNAVMLNEMGLA